LGIDVDLLFVNSHEGRLRHKAYGLGFIQFWRALGRHRYDVIHAHYVFSGIIARAQWQTPLVLTHHGIEVHGGWQGPLCRWTSRFVDETIVVARWMKADIPAPGVHVIPCGVDLRIFKPMDRAEARRILNLEQGRRYVLFAGGWWRPEKRFALLQQAVDLLRSRHPDVELLKVSHEPHERLPLYMNAADALALVSVREGSPQVVKEAMACGLPVIATNAGDAWDVIADTPGCYPVEPEPSRIAAALEQAMTPPRRTDGPARMQRFSLENIARSVVSVYEQACRTPAAVG
jgi:glycosyltransferase involved in cell wall biosynthesis